MGCDRVSPGGTKFWSDSSDQTAEDGNSLYLLVLLLLPDTQTCCRGLFEVFELEEKLPPAWRVQREAIIEPGA